MMVGCTPFSSSSWHFLSSAPQMTVTEVVPSPATTSCGVARARIRQAPAGPAAALARPGRWITCDFASSTSILAAGWVTVILLRMVAPSLVMMTSPPGADT
jgi:hypothetical protein